MSLRKIVVGLHVLALAAGAGLCAELGRQPVGAPGGGGSGAPDVIKGYSSTPPEAGPGIEAGFGLNAVSWKVGSDTLNDQAWSPEASVFYGVGQHFDIHVTAKYMQVSDEGDGAIDYKTDFFRIGVGPRAWLDTGTDWSPYADLLLNYYFMRNDPGSGDRGMPGLSGEAGIAYLVNEFVVVKAGIQAETTLTNGKVDLATGTENVSMQAIGIGLGVMVLF